MGEGMNFQDKPLIERLYLTALWLRNEFRPGLIPSLEGVADLLDEAGKAISSLHAITNMDDPEQ
jgi:hypothetical protein